MEPKDLYLLSPQEAVERMMRDCGGIFVMIIRHQDAVRRLKMEEDEILNDFGLHILEKNAAPLYLWQGRCKFCSWTALIFRRWLRDRLRPAARTTEIEGAIDFLPTPGDDICDKIHKADVEAKLHECIQALPDLHRQVIRDKMYHEPKLEQLGKKYKLGKKIYVFVHNIFRQLESCLAKKNIQFGDI